MELSAFQLRGELGRAKADAKVVFKRVCANCANSFYIYVDSMCCHCPGFIRNFMCLKNEFTFWLGACSISSIFFFCGALFCTACVPQLAVYTVPLVMISLVTPRHYVVAAYVLQATVQW